MKKLALALAVTVLMLDLTGCYGMRRSDAGLVAGGVAGGIAGSALTHGSAVGTIGGAVGGAYIGHELAY